MLIINIIDIVYLRLYYNFFKIIMTYFYAQSASEWGGVLLLLLGTKWNYTMIINK